MGQRVVKRSFLLVAVMSIMLFAMSITAFADGGVTGLKQTGVSASEVAISYNEVTNASGYLVYYAGSDGVWQRPYGRTEVSQLDSRSNSVTISGLKAATVYTVKVVPVFIVNGTYATDENQAGTLQVFTSPNVVTGLKQTKATAKTATLSWKKVSGANKYYIVNSSRTKIIAKTTKTSVTIKKLKTGSANIYYVYAVKKFNKKKFTVKDFKESLVNMGLKKGDTVIVHSAWRSFIGFEGRPQDVIDSIKNIIGEEGNILMPAFTDNFEVFKYNDKSCAGVITEVFRNNKDVQRSLNNMFSMCAYGKKSTLYLSEHIDSNYCFDDKSPYYKATQDDAKILLLGLGKKPHKITLFHCASYALKDKLSYYKNVYSYKKNVTIYDQNNKKINKAIIDRLPTFQNGSIRYIFI